MPQQYTVPQFIDVEDKILGPLTVRQFVIFLAVGLTLFIMYKILTFAFFIIAGLPFAGFGFVLAFIKVNGQPFHLFLLNLLQTSRRPGLRVWDKTLSLDEVRALLKTPPIPPRPPKIRKEPLSTNKLSELSLGVNPGGVSRAEDYA